MILDVVLNHTGEGDARGPTLSLRGLDNATCYRVFADDRARYVDDTGCGNTLALDRAPVLRLAMDVLRYYAAAAGVDGFRFDLATTLGRRADGFDPAAPLLQAIAQDPVLRDLKLIAEPWDVGPGGHRLGAFPPSWGEWNDRYRDVARRFWRGDGGLTGELATRVAGSADVFAARSRPPSRSVNFVTAHDGFTLADLVAYATKHNEANGEDNRDGTDANWSWNHGVEGPTADPAVRAARERDVRNLLATLLLSRGTPMLAMGDELGRTQRGNNNAYAQDTALTWIDWKTADRTLIAFVARLVALRKRHPALRVERWLTGAPVDASGLPDVEWRHPDGRAMTADDWTLPEGRALVAVLYAAPAAPSPADRVAVAFNAGAEPVTVHWPDAREGFVWRRVIDTASPGRMPAIRQAPARATTSMVAATVGARPRRKCRALRPDAGPRASSRTYSTGSPPPPALRGVVGSGRWSVTSSAPIRSVRCSRRWGCRWHRPTRRACASSRSPTRASVARCPRWSSRARVSRREVAIAADECEPAPSGPLRLRARTGPRLALPFDGDDLPANAVTAVDGRTVHRRILTLPPLPAGYHTLRSDDPADCRRAASWSLRSAASCRRKSAPASAASASPRTCTRCGGAAIRASATTRRCRAVAAATARAGGSIVGINPLHALFGEERERASPYHPSDRRFLDPIYIDVERVPELAASDDARALLARHGRRIAALSAQRQRRLHRPSGS